MKEYLNSVRDRIRRWKAGELSGLWADVVSLDIKLCKRGRRKVTLESQQDDMVHRACQAMEQGCYRKTIQLLSSSGLV